MKRSIWLSAGLFLTGACQSIAGEADVVIDLGQHGTVFEIVEEDMLDLLIKRSSAMKNSGKLQEIEDSFKTKAKESVLNPRPVAGLETTTKERSFTYDPTLTLDKDIKDHEGILIGAKGKRINPLEFLKLSKGLLFVDGTKENQLSWAIAHKNRFRIVLTNGSPVKLEKTHDTRFYFDQAGVITKRYGITSVPAKIEQQGRLLRITEFVVGEGG